MLSIKSADGSSDRYYNNLVSPEYYTKSGEPPGLWLGSGATQLGLTGRVEPEEFSRLFAGFSPDGERKLVQNAGEESRRPGWDLTFSAPKSVSVAWSQADPAFGDEIRASHLEAVTKALAYIEEHCGHTRRGKGGILRQKSKLIAAAFEHSTSRSLDPQLHTHVLLLNIGIAPNGFSGAITSQEIYQHKMAAGAIYRAELAYQIESRLGLETERNRTWFELVGVAKELVSHFSKRRQEVEAALALSGYSSAKAAEIAALDSRGVKEQICRKELFKSWRKDGETIGWGPEAFRQLRESSEPFHEVSAEAAADNCLAEALDSITQGNSYFSERELVRRSAEFAQGTGLGSDRVLDRVREFIENEAVPLQNERGYPQFTTKEVLACEMQLIKRVEEARTSRDWFIPEWLIEKNLTSRDQSQMTGSFTKPRFELNDGQKEAVRHITSGTAPIVCVEGDAGTGKTTMLGEARKLWQGANLKVIGASLSGKAADGLSEGAGIESYTIAKLLYQIDSGKQTLTPSTVLVIDEAGMVGTRMMLRIVDEARSAGAKLVLVGDSKQLQPIEAGGPFRMISERVGRAEMTTIIRQKEEWQKDVVKALSKGEAKKALNELNERGCLHIADDREAAIESLVQDWGKDGLVDPENTLVLAGTNKDTYQLNRKIQAVRLAEGQLGDETLSNDHAVFRENDRVIFTRNSGPLGVRNGNMGTIVGLNRDLDAIAVRLSDDSVRSFTLSEYSDLKLAYSVTTHKSQGMTCDGTVLILADEAMSDRHLSYVQASRSRTATHIYSSKDEAGVDLASLAKIMGRERLKGMASDLLPDEPRTDQEPTRPKIQLGLEIQP